MKLGADPAPSHDGVGPGLFRTPGRFAAALLFAFVAAVALNAGVRHIADPDRFPILDDDMIPLAMDTFIGPQLESYRSWFRWDAIHTGDIDAVFEAAQRRRAAPPLPLYEPDHLREGRSSFVYSPHVALAVSPMVPSSGGLETAASRVSRLNHVLALAGMVLLLVTVNRPRRASVLENICFAATLMLFYPLAKALELTQLTIWIFSLVALSFFFFSARRPVLAGLALGLGVSIKPHLALIPLFLFLRGGHDLRFFVGCGISLAGVAAASLAYAGPENCLAYVFDALPALSAGYGYFPNQSAGGLLLRTFTDTDPQHYSLVESHAWIRVASLLFGGSVFVLALRAARAQGRDGTIERRILSYGAAVVVAVSASPILWEHHLVVLLVPYACCIWLLRRRRELRSFRLEAGLFASFVLVGFGVETRYLPNGPAALLSIPNLYGALVLLVSLTHMGRRLPAPASPSRSGLTSKGIANV